MSFSSGVKDELSRVIPEKSDLRRAELRGMLVFSGRLRTEAGQKVLVLSSEHAATVRKYFTALRFEYKIRERICVLQRPSLRRSRGYAAALSGQEETVQVLKDLKLEEDPEMPGTLRPVPEEEMSGTGGPAPDMERLRAYLRGAFLSSGSLSDPEKGYHLEFVCPNDSTAASLKAALQASGIGAGAVRRKKTPVVYVKDSDQIVELLGLMGAPSSLMEMENVRILKEMRNSVNRQVNCEAANISKTVGAALRQLEDIVYLKERWGLDTLPESLRETAELRLAFPEASLKELGERHSTPVGKSGVNHRLRKLSEYAADLRGEGD